MVLIIALVIALSGLAYSLVSTNNTNLTAATTCSGDSEGLCNSKGSLLDPCSFDQFATCKTSPNTLVFEQTGQTFPIWSSGSNNPSYPNYMDFSLTITAKPGVNLIFQGCYQSQTNLTVSLTGFVSGSNSNYGQVSGFSNCFIWNYIVQNGGSFTMSFYTLNVTTSPPFNQYTVTVTEPIEVYQSG